MAQCMHFMKTGCDGKISQVSEFQNHLQTKSNLHILSVRTDSKTQFAMTDPAEEAWKLWMKGKKSLQLRTFA